MSAPEGALPLPHPDVTFCTVDTGAVLLHTRDEVYFGLNKVGADVWELLPPVSATIGDLVTAMSLRWPDVDRHVLHADVEELLETLRAQNLVVPATNA